MMIDCEDVAPIVLLTSNGYGNELELNQIVDVDAVDDNSPHPQAQEMMEQGNPIFEVNNTEIPSSSQRGGQGLQGLEESMEQLSQDPYQLRPISPPSEDDIFASEQFSSVSQGSKEKSLYKIPRKELSAHETMAKTLQETAGGLYQSQEGIERELTKRRQLELESEERKMKGLLDEGEK